MHPLVEIRQAIGQAVQNKLSLKDIPLDPAPDFLRDRFDLAAPIGFVLAPKGSGLKPLPLTQEAHQALPATGAVETASVHPPCYINFRLHPDVLGSLCAQAAEGRYPGDFPWQALGAPSSVLLEFCSANPTGPLHFGHGRGALLGDTLARIFKFTGARVHTEYYINDVGTQIERLGASLEARYHQEILGQKDRALPEEGYSGEYLRILAQRLPKNLELDALGFSNIAKKELLQVISNDLAALGVNFDRWFAESELHANNVVNATIERLKTGGYIEEKDGALWFQSKNSAEEDKERVLRRRDGRTTYFASDLAYHEDKLKRGHDLCINIWGADHHGYIPRVRLGLQALGLDPDRLEIILIQMVRLLRNGQPVTLSKRSGDYITLREIAQEVGPEALRFFLNSRGPSAQLDFDLEIAKKQAPENPVYLIQYAHARIASIKREKAARNVSWPQEKDANIRLVLEQDQKTRDLALSIVLFPEAILSCALRRSGHYLANYLIELARIFNGYYETHPMLSEPNPELAWSRFTLCRAVQNVLATGLGLLGISAPEKM
ncbi:MAG: arginine--tRNA ligase [Elusimicrobia bacterium]|nr:arginine--tRNA ligase [Elusimicrobiota bacterium]